MLFLTVIDICSRVNPSSTFTPTILAYVDVFTNLDTHIICKNYVTLCKKVFKPVTWCITMHNERR